MKQEDYDMLKSAKRAGAKAELEMEKVQYMLLSAQRMLVREKDRNPELYEMMELFRVWTEIRDARKQLENAQEMAGIVFRYLNYQDTEPPVKLHSQEFYPVYPPIYRTVADAQAPHTEDAKISHKG